MSAACAITFEGGEEPEPAHAILELLRGSGLAATFFLDGLWAEVNPDLVRAIAAAGHELGNHGHGHKEWRVLDEAGVLADLGQVEALAETLTGRGTRPWALPPLGFLDERIGGILARAGYRPVNPEPLDARTFPDRSPSGIAERLVSGARDGEVLVVHTGRWETVDALREALPALRDRGFRIATISALGRPPTYRDRPAHA